MPSIKSILMPIAILGLGGLVAAGIFQMTPTAAQSPPEAKVTPVSFLTLSPKDLPSTVETTGVVSAATQVTILPQVSGQVVMVSDNLIAGGRLTKGDQLIRIDPRDYRLAVNQTKVKVKSAELELAMEGKRQGIAEREWKLLGKDGDASDLVLRKPQLGVAQMNVRAAKSARDSSKLMLERTGIFAPFNAMVVMENVDMGQVVGPASQVATLIGTDQFFVTVSLPVEDLRLLTIPDINTKESVGSKAIVKQALGDGTAIKRDAHVIRLSGQLDPQTRRAQVILAIDNPLEAGTLGSLPLLPGAFVEVTLMGPEVGGVYQVPRAAVHQGSFVWLADKDDKLSKKNIESQWETDEDLYVTGELSPGDRLIVSPLPLPIVGAQVAPLPANI